MPRTNRYAHEMRRLMRLADHHGERLSIRNGLLGLYEAVTKLSVNTTTHFGDRRSMKRRIANVMISLWYMSHTLGIGDPHELFEQRIAELEGRTGSGA